MSSASPRTILYSAWAPFYSGAERALVLLLRGLDRRRFRPVVAVGTDGELAAQLRAMRVEVRIVSIVYRDRVRVWPWLRSVARFVRLARETGAALVHANDVPSFQPAGYAARWLGLPAICHVRFPDTVVGFDWFLKPGFARALFVSEQFRGAMVAEAPGLFSDRSEAVHDCVLLPELADAHARQRLRQELGLPADGAVVALTGQVAEVKGLWDFIEAARLLRTRNVPAMFAILGDDLKGKGALRREAEQRVASVGLDSHFRFLGFRPDAPRLIQAFDVVAVPSHVEPFGLAALEASAAGVPVVASRIGGLPEIVADDVTGRLVACRDPMALAAAIERFVRDPGLARTFGAAGRRRAGETFSVEAHVGRVAAIYEAVTGSRQPD